MTFRQALAKHRFIAALLLIGMAIYFFLLVMHIHAILTLNAPLSFTSFYLVFCLFTRICGRNPVPGVRQAGDISTLLQF